MSRLLGLLAWLAFATGASGQDSLPVRVNAAIDRGVVWLKSQQKPDGTFACDHWCPEGTTALATYALLKSGVLASDPAVQKAVAWLRYQPFAHTYAVSVEIAAFDALHDPALEKLIQEAAEWLEAKQFDEGVWAYPDRHPDLSNSQYAALGLWVAERHGFKAKRETWGKLLKEVVRRQNADGGFGYREGDGATGSMTTAGIAMLLLSLERVESDPRYGSTREKGKAALARAWKWLEERFTVEGNPHDDRTIVPTNQLYYLFGLERIGAIGERKKIGEHDWYEQGATRIVSMQHPDGAWRNCDSTSFALLFLRRATFTGMRKERAGGADAPRESTVSQESVKPRPETPFLRRWLVCGPVLDPKHDLLEAPFSGDSTVEPQAGSAFRGKSWMERRALGDRIAFGEGSAADPAIYYAFTWLHVAKETDVVLWLGSQDGALLLLDGKTIFTRHVHGKAVRDKISVPVNLAPGAHRLLVKLEQAARASGFYLRITHADGTPARDVLPSLDARDLQLEATTLAMPGLFTLAKLRANLPPMPRASIDFRSRKDLELLAFDCVCDFEDRYPRWLDVPKSEPGNPHPGARGILNVHPLSETIPTRIYLRTTLPAAPIELFVRVSEEPFVPKVKSDFQLRLGVFTNELTWIAEPIIGPSPAPDARNWRVVDAPLDPWAGRDVLLVIECASGGSEPWSCEQAYFDEIAVK